MFLKFYIFTVFCSKLNIFFCGQFSAPTIRIFFSRKIIPLEHFGFRRHYRKRPNGSSETYIGYVSNEQTIIYFVTSGTRRNVRAEKSPFFLRFPKVTKFDFENLACNVIVGVCLAANYGEDVVFQVSKHNFRDIIISSQNPSARPSLLACIVTHQNDGYYSFCRIFIRHIKLRRNLVLNFFLKLKCYVTELQFIAQNTFGTGNFRTITDRNFLTRFFFSFTVFVVVEQQERDGGGAPPLRLLLSFGLPPQHPHPILFDQSPLASPPQMSDVPVTRTRKVTFLDH